MNYNNEFKSPDKEEKGFKFMFVNGKLWPKVKIGRIDYIRVIVAISFYFIVMGMNMLTDKPKHNYVINPVSKIILKYKAIDYIEDKYPDFQEDATVNMSTGMIKFNTGYMVTCYDENDTASKVTVYFDKKFNVTKDAENIIQRK